MPCPNCGEKVDVISTPNKEQPKEYRKFCHIGSSRGKTVLMFHL